MMGVEIKLYKDYYLLSDSIQWIIAKKNKNYDSNNPKSPKFSHESFYTNLEYCIKSTILRLGRESNAKTIEELKDFIISVSKALQETSPVVITITGEKK